MILKRSFLYGAFLGILIATIGVNATHWRIINYGTTPIDASLNILMFCGRDPGNTFKNIQPGQVAYFYLKGMCIGEGITLSKNGQKVGGNSYITLGNKDADVYVVSSADGTTWTAQTA